MLIFIVPINVNYFVSKSLMRKRVLDATMEKIVGTITENLPSSALTNQICKCTIVSTFDIVWMPGMALPSPPPLNNVGINVLDFFFLR